MQPFGQKTGPISAIIGLGANLASTAGEPEVTLRRALTLLKGKDLHVETVSRFYITPCFPENSAPDYVNAVAILIARLSAADLLSRLHEIETELGRDRMIRWGQRTLDLDLLAYGEVIRPDLTTFRHWMNLPLGEQMKEAPTQLILPHPRIQDRAFVLVPLAEIAPEWRHPVLGYTATQMRDELDPADVAHVKPL